MGRGGGAALSHRRLRRCLELPFDRLSSAVLERNCLTGVHDFPYLFIFEEVVSNPVF